MGSKQWYCLGKNSLVFVATIFQSVEKTVLLTTYFIKVGQKLVVDC